MLGSRDFGGFRHMTRAGRRNKYHAKAFTDSNGMKWHSQGEFKRWQELQLLEAAGHICDLKRQVKFPLHVHPFGGTSKIEIGKYIADFQYIEQRAGKNYRCVEEHKGVWTPTARWKLRHFETEYGIKVLITGGVARARLHANP